MIPYKDQRRSKEQVVQHIYSKMLFLIQTAPKMIDRYPNIFELRLCRRVELLFLDSKSHLKHLYYLRIMFWFLLIRERDKEIPNHQTLNLMLSKRRMEYGLNPLFVPVSKVQLMISKIVYNSLLKNRVSSVLANSWRFW